MFKIKIADLIISIDNRFDFVKNICKDYIITSDVCDFSVKASEDEIAVEKTMTSEFFSDGYIESICIYRNIANKLPKYNAFVMHGAAIEYNGNGYCFTAKSGTGKTTHIKLWHKVFGNKVRPINGDKPIIRLIDGIFYIYGTPWSGKENYNTNIKCPLKSICFIERSVTNSIDRVPTFNALNKILHQVYLPKSNNIFDKTLTLLELMLVNVPFWNLKCNISDEAAIIAHNAFNNGN